MSESTEMRQLRERLANLDSVKFREEMTGPLLGRLAALSEMLVKMRRALQ